MKPPKRRPTASTPPAAPTAGAVRIGFSDVARADFEKLATKVQKGLRRKLREFGMNPAIGKPLVAELQGYRRVTYGRVRSIAEFVVKVTGRVVIVHYVGLRKAGSSDDPYEAAAVAALNAGDRDAIAALEALVQQAVHGPQTPDDDDE